MTSSTPVRYSFWGGNYPPLATTFWHGHFPEPGATLVLANITPTQALVGAQGLVGVALLGLVLEDGASVTFTFPTSVIKFRSGKEQRISGRDYPAQVYRGNVTVVGDDVRALRGQFARFIALGSAFQLALPHEETTVTATSSGQVVTVDSTSSLDWAIPGQTVVVMNDSGSRVAAVVQSKTATAINLDVALGAVGVVGARVMPTVPVYLDAQQGFERYAPVDGVEVWQINARAIQPGFTSSSVAAVLALSTVSTSGVLAGLVLVWNVPGTAGNAATVQFQHATLGVGINVTITQGAGTMLVRFRAGVATVQDLVDAMILSTSQLTMEGTYNATDVLNLTVDEFGATHLAGGVDGAAATVGIGASVTMYDGRPVWDRGVMVDSATAMDSVHALTELVDFGGTPYNPADGTIADWGRQVSITSDSTAEFQWLKAALAAIRGSQVAFWLPSWRNDLRSTSVTAGAAAVAATLLFSTFSTGNASGVVATAVATGPSGNSLRVSLAATTNPADNNGTFQFTSLGLLSFKYVAGTTTIAQMVTAFATSGLATLGGTYTGTNKLLAGDAGNAYLTGGTTTVGSVIVVPQDAAHGDFAAWSAQRDRLRVVQVDGAITYTKILSVFVDGNNATFRLSVDAALSGVAIASISWLELVRFEGSEKGVDVVVTFKTATFSMNQQARVVQQ